MKKIRIYDEITETLIREVFFSLSESLGFKMLSSREGFPDFLLLRGDKLIRAEVESFASNFYLHNHSEDNCDMVICFENDLEKEVPLEILELNQFIEIMRGTRENKLVSQIRGVDISEIIMRILAKEKYYGKKTSVNKIVRLIKRDGVKGVTLKISRTLRLLRKNSEGIIGEEKLGRASYFWINVERARFRIWFKETFGTEIEMKGGSENQKVSISSQYKNKEAEEVVRYLAREGIYGNKKSPNAISTGLIKSNIKIYHQKVEKILTALVFAGKSIFAFEKIDKISYYWIKVDKDTFKNWFKEWFEKEFEEKKE